MNQTSAKVAIIIRTKNRPLLLERALQSIANQVFKDYIAVIVNDGGDKQELENLIQSKEALAEKLVVIHNTKSLGMEAASNIGINNSSSDYIVIHDDDDSWHPEFLNKTIDFLENNKNNKIAGVLTYFTKVIEKIENNEVKELEQINAATWIEEISLWRMMEGNFFPPIAFIFKRLVFEEIGGFYREDLPVLGDWEFNLRFLKKFQIHLIKENLAFYHHRLETNGSAYGNTVTDQILKHETTNSYLRNEALLEDLKKLNFSEGLAWNLAHRLRQLENYLSQKDHNIFIELRSHIERLENNLENHINKSNSTLENLSTKIDSKFIEQQDLLMRIYSPIKFLRKLIGKK